MRPRIPHRAPDLFPNENDVRQPTRHAAGFYRWNPRLWQLFWSARHRASRQHQRPSVYSDNFGQFPSVRVQSRPNLLASGSHRGDLNVEEGVESHNRVDGRLCVPLSVSLLPLGLLFWGVHELNQHVFKASSRG